MNDNNIHFQQSAAWETFQKALGRTVIHHHEDGWDYRAILEPQRFGMSRLYCPYGPSVSSKESLQTAVSSLKYEGRKLGAVYVRVQPLGLGLNPSIAAAYGLKKINYSQPALTWRIDTTQSKEAILGDMKQNNRNIYNTSEKKGLRYHRSDSPADLSSLLQLLHTMATHNAITLHSDHYLTTQAESLLAIGAAHLHFISYQDEIIAAALVYEDEHGYYYAHAAADYEHRKLNAATSLLAHIILDAHANDKQFCDLYGISPTNQPNHRWAGFTRFKQSFGGYQYELSDTYELPINNFRYSLLSITRLVARLIR